MEDVACSIVIIEPLEAVRNQQHPPQFSQDGQLQTLGQLRTTAEKNAQRAVCRPNEQSLKIPYDVAAEPLRIIDDKYRRLRILVPFQLLTEPGRKSQFIVVPRGYLYLFCDNRDQIIEEEPGTIAAYNKRPLRFEL